MCVMKLLFWNPTRMIKLATFLTAFIAVNCASIEDPLTTSCTVKSYNEVSAALASCSNVIIDGITVPGGKSLDLKLKTGSSLTFRGKITFEHYNWAGPLVIVEGSKVTVAGEAGAILDGQGPKYWDGKGGSGSTKPRFFKVRTTGGSELKNIHLLNCPINCVSIGASDTVLEGWTIDVSAGDKAGGKNTDGFDISGSNHITVRNSLVKNQDDCVAVNQGSNYLFSNLTCSGGHGLSLSVGLSKQNGAVNTVKNVTFSDCTVINSANAIHVKTHSDGGTGEISDVTYKNIKIGGITRYGINVQEDYEQGHSTRHPKGNVPITNLKVAYLYGKMSGSSSVPVYVLCGTGGCSNWHWSGVSITGAKKSSSCNFSISGYKC